MLWILDWRLLVLGLTTKLIFRCTRVTFPNVGPNGSCCFTLCITDIHHWMFEKGANSNYWYNSYMWYHLPLYCLLELSFNSRWPLVRSWWFCTQVVACLGSLWCMLGGSVEVHEVLNEFGPQWTDIGCSHSISNTTSKVEGYNWLCLHNNQWKTSEDKLLTKSPTKMKDNLTLCWFKFD